MMTEVAESMKKSPTPVAGGGRFFKQLDLFPKIDENYRVQTGTGAIFSIAGWVIIVLLLLVEIRNFATPTFKEHMIVDTTLGDRLEVNIDITFHSLTCLEAHLDVMDVAGDNQLNIEHDMLKQRISPDGQPIGKAGIEIIGEGMLDPVTDPPDPCGDCYGAETEGSKCCPTCDSLIQAYQKKQWSIAPILRNSTQCVRERANQFVTVNNGEGCRVNGKMTVNKVAGNFHIAHGESIVRDGRHIHQFNPTQAAKYNISHTINSLTFGSKYQSMPANPLDGVSKVNTERTGLYQYFIKVIPTIYTSERGQKIYTNQYTVTDRFRPLELPKLDANGVPQHVEAILPGIFFIFELSPFMIEASKSRVPLLHFITKVCAIVGGVFSVMGVLDSAFHKLQGVLFKKNN